MSEAASAPLMTADEFLAWAEGREGKYELDNGRVLAMAPERVAHGRIKAAIFRALAEAVSASRLPCEAFTDSIAVRVDQRTSYIPDVLLHCGERLGGDERETNAAAIVVEVLSPSTAYRDASAKLEGYFRVPSIQHYLIVDADRRLVIHHRRDHESMIATRIVASDDIPLDPPGIRLSVAAIFEAL